MPQVPLQVFMLVNVSLFSPSCLLKEKCFQASRSIANKRYRWYVTKSVYVAMTIFLPGKKKKRTRNLPFTYMGVHISCKMMHSRMHNTTARGGLETKFIRKCFMRKGNSSITTMNLLARKIWSNLFCIFTFIIMQVVLLNICLGQR